MRVRPRVRWVGVWMAVIVAGVAASAADAPSVSSLDYWPMAPGTTWVYADGQGRQRVVRVVDQERLDDERVTVVEHTVSGDAAPAWLYYAVRDGQVLLIAQREMGKVQRRLRVPLVFWPATVALGTRWRLVPANDRSPERVIVRREQVSVPAGTYEALVIFSYAKTGITTTQWRAAGVGVLREVTQRPDGSRQTMELLRFEIPASPPSSPSTAP